MVLKPLKNGCYFKMRNINGLVIQFRASDKFGWRCMTPTYKAYKNYHLIRKGSLFDNFNIGWLKIMRIVIKYTTRQSQNSIKRTLNYRNGAIDRF